MLSFLDLSQDIRYRIYAYANLVRTCPVEVNRPHVREQENGSGRPFFSVFADMRCLYQVRRSGGDMSLGPDLPDCQCPKLPMQLFLVSRAVSKEVFSLFYSLNKFVVRAQTPQDLRALHLSPQALRTMKSLLIRLNSWPCPRGHEGVYLDDSKCLTCMTPARRVDRLLDITSTKSTTSQDLLVEWQKFAHQLALSISPGTLKLTFICDVANKETALAVLKPFAQLPTLKECTIRLGRRFDYQLYHLAHETSHRATQSLFQAHGTFPFQRLPKELRLQVLNSTGLVSRNAAGHPDGTIAIRDNNKLVTADCCRKCTTTLVDCCCVALRAAYSPTCTCRRIPLELFLVNKEMRTDAIEVLLSQNTLQFSQDPSQTIDFFSRFPPNAPQFVRNIQLFISEEDIERWTQLDYNAKLDSLATFLKSHCALPRLTISIVVESWDIGCHVSDEGESETRFLYDICVAICRSLRKTKTKALNINSDDISLLEDVQIELGWFTELEPRMREAILGKGHSMVRGVPDKLSRDPRVDGSLALGFRKPSWYREGDLEG